MHLEVLVEEPSAEEALNGLIPKILGTASTYRIHVYNGKPDLLKKLPSRLRGYARFLPDDWRLIVLVDRDGQDCRHLKDELEAAARDAGLKTRSAGGWERCQVLNRIAVEELEAWFFGDPQALRQSFPGLQSGWEERAAYRDPDAIRGGTFEALQRLLQSRGYYREGVPKIRLAREVARHMDPQRNRSRSFVVFRDGLRRLAGA